MSNPILDRISSINKKFLDDLDLEAIPTDPEEFLKWWWEERAKDCQDCPLSLTRNSVVAPDGNTKAKIMIISEGPGFLEDLTSIPMVGPMELRGSHCSDCKNAKTCFGKRMLPSPKARAGSPSAIKCKPNYSDVTKFIGGEKFYLRSAGSILDGIILKKWKLNYPRKNWLDQYNKNHPGNELETVSPWFITNITLCRTTDITGLKDGPPESLPRTKCKRHLAFQWAAVNPELIVCFGRVALSVLVGSEEGAKGIAPNTIIDTKFGPVLFQLHPASFMRERNREAKALGFAKIGSTLEKALEYVGLPIE